MKERPILFSGPMVRAILAGTKTQTRRLLSSPLAKAEVGDRLWVRETWQRPRATDAEAYLFPVRYQADSRIIWHDGDEKGLKASDYPTWANNFDGWVPSIFIYRWASRITLEVTEVRREHLQDISTKDIFAEGVPLADPDTPPWDEEDTRFSVLWDSLNAKRGYGWAENPEVVVISFRRYLAAT